MSLYVISALFGLFQGGIVPMYAIIVREYFSPAETGTRLGIVLMATLVGMALGGWMSGVIFDFTGSYRAAFLNGLAWNLLNVGSCSGCCCGYTANRRCDCKAHERRRRAQHRVLKSTKAQECALGRDQALDHNSVWYAKPAIAKLPSRTTPIS